MKDNKEPRLKSSKYFEYKCPEEILGLHEFFYEEPAYKWCLETFLDKLSDKETDLDFEQSKELFFCQFDPNQKPKDRR